MVTLRIVFLLWETDIHLLTSVKHKATLLGLPPHLPHEINTNIKMIQAGDLLCHEK